MDKDFGILTPEELKFVKNFEKRIRKAERERIIALLEAEGVLNGSALSDNWSRAIIALIKGENE